VDVAPPVRRRTRVFELGNPDEESVCCAPQGDVREWRRAGLPDAEGFRLSVACFRGSANERSRSASGCQRVRHVHPRDQVAMYVPGLRLPSDGVSPWATALRPGVGVRGGSRPGRRHVDTRAGPRLSQRPSVEQRKRDSDDDEEHLVDRPRYRSETQSRQPSEWPRYARIRRRNPDSSDRARDPPAHTPDSRHYVKRALAPAPLVLLQEPRHEAGRARTSASSSAHRRRSRSSIVSATTSLSIASDFSGTERVGSAASPISSRMPSSGTQAGERSAIYQ
jgi:hypothetical protein